MLHRDRGIAAALAQQVTERCTAKDAETGEELPFFEAIAKAPSESLRRKTLRRLRTGSAGLSLDPYALSSRGKLPRQFVAERVDQPQLAERAYTAAMACVLTPDDLDTGCVSPLSTLVANDCELLRVALLTEQSLPTRTRLFEAASEGAANLRDELEKQAWLSAPGCSPPRSPRPALSPAEQQRQAAVLARLRAKPAYTATLRFSRLRAVGVSPAGGWPRGIRPELCVVIRAVGPDLDPETDFLATQAARVDVHSGDVVWDTTADDLDDAGLVLQLSARPSVIQIELAFAGADAADMTAPRLGKGQLPPVWNPRIDPDNPAQQKHATIRVELTSTTTQDIEEATAAAALVGRRRQASRMMSRVRHRTQTIALQAVAGAQDMAVALMEKESGGHSVDGGGGGGGGGGEGVGGDRAVESEQQRSILKAFFDLVEPEKPPEEWEAMLDERRGADSGAVSSHDFKSLCKHLEHEYSQSPLNAWEATLDTPPALVTFDYSFDFCQCNPPRHDWDSLNGVGKAPSTAPTNFSDDSKEIFRTLAHFLLPCNFALGSSASDAELRGKHAREELERVAQSLGLSWELLGDALEAFNNDPIRVLEHLRQVEKEREASRVEHQDSIQPQQESTSLSLEAAGEDEELAAAVDTVQIDAVDWLLEDFSIKYGVPVTFRKVTELLVLSTQFTLSTTYLIRLKTTLQAVAAHKSEMLVDELELCETLNQHFCESLLKVFCCYKANYDHAQPDCPVVVKLAISLLKMLAPEDWRQQLSDALWQWPANFMSTMVKGGKLDGRRWAPPLPSEVLAGTPQYASKLSRVCQAIQEDLVIDDTDFRFLFDATPIVDINAKEFTEWVWVMARMFIQDAPRGLYRKEGSITLYLSLRSLLECLYGISPANHEMLNSHDLDQLFEPVLQARLVAEQAHVKSWVSRMIESDEWEPLEPGDDRRLHSVSGHDLVQLLVDAVHPLIHRWPLSNLATLVCEVLWFYCEQIELLAIQELDILVGEDLHVPMPEDEQVARTRPRAKTMGRKKSRPVVPVEPSENWWVKLNCLFFSVTQAPAIICESLSAHEDAYGDEDLEAFSAAVFECESRCNASLNAALNHAIDLQAKCIANIICKLLAAEGVNSDRWAELKDFFDDVLGNAVDRVSTALFRKFLHRVADMFARVFEAIMVGEIEVHGFEHHGHSLSKHVEDLQQCLSTMSEYFQVRCPSPSLHCAIRCPQLKSVVPAGRWARLV